MKKFTLLILLAVLFSFGTASAIPAYHGARKMTQPDGSSVTLRLVGDEYLHFNTTADGYSVVKDERGYYVYAQKAEGRLAATDMVAHDEAGRTTAERAYLQGIKKYLAPQMEKRAAEQQQTEQAARAARLQQNRVQQYDYSKFRGLILLVEYNDCEFRYDNYRDIMEGMVNEENYHGTNITNISRTEGVCVGSVRDYYTDCSNGLFVPDFDVVGPIKVDRSQFFYGGDRINNWWDNAYYLMADAINAADAEVDFSLYDGDNDGYVDMVYFIFAGMGSNFSGNDERLLWPHASEIYNPYGGGNNYTLRKDGKYLGRYACGTELYGWDNWTTLDGIGTICHEFGHVLGLPDFYDTDYEDSGGESHHPGEWSVMAGGGYLNYGRSPAVYTLFERYALGWATPQTISSEGTFELKSIDESNTGYRIDAQNKNEYFLFENRQQTKWNAYLPGHGMLVFRVDSTNTNVWNRNLVNANPKHNYFELLRAGGWQNSQGAYQFASDPFPGTSKVSSLNNVTSPANLISWAGKETLLGLENIAENSQGVITFDVVDVNMLRAISLPESIVVGKGATRQLTETREPDYAPYILQWASDNEAVATVSSSGMVTGVSEGTANITVTARSPKQSEAEAVTATCQVIVEQQTVVQNIAEFKQLDEDTEAALMLNNAQVLYKYSGNYYVRDNTGCVVIKGTGADWAVNSLLNGSLYGSYQTANRMPQFVANSHTDLTAVSNTAGSDVEPVAKRVGEVGETDYADLLTLTRAKLQIVGTSGVFAVQGDKRIRVYNTFGLKSITVPKTYDGKRFNVTGVMTTRTLNGELIDEIALTQSIVEVDAPRFTLTYNILEGGHVLVNASTKLTGEGTSAFLEGDDVVLQLVPDEGYEVEGVLLDATQLTLEEGQNELRLQEIADDHSLTVLFHEIEESGIERVGNDSQLAADAPVTVYTAGGTIVVRTTLGALSRLRLPAGIYIIKTTGGTMKMVRP